MIQERDEVGQISDMSRSSPEYPEPAMIREICKKTLFPNAGTIIHALLLAAIYVFYVAEVDPRGVAALISALFFVIFASPIPIAGYVLFRLPGELMRRLAWEYTVPAIILTTLFYIEAPEAASSDAQGALIYLIPAFFVGIPTAACIIVVEALFFCRRLVRGEKKASAVIREGMEKAFPNTGAWCTLAALAVEYILSSMLMCCYGQEPLAEALFGALISLPTAYTPLFLAWFFFFWNQTETRRIGWEILVSCVLFCSAVQIGWLCAGSEIPAGFLLPVVGSALKVCGLVVAVCEAVHYFLRKRRGTRQTH